MMDAAKVCNWRHEPLPPLRADASYVDEINPCGGRRVILPATRQVVLRFPYG